jgi:1-aminocyclopropane-1-carboxylate deaminase/D-cysteine desulfhydrase-like pyridoxal-dependent ACC family enzyme
MTQEAALGALASVPRVDLGRYPTPVEELTRLRKALGGGPRLLVKRDDAIPFAFGGNKVRKLELVAAQALAEGADTLITCGGVQSNHARVTAAAAARLGLECVLVVNGPRPERATANALLDVLLGAELEYVATREERAPAMRAAIDRLRGQGRRPFEIPVGASTPLGALAYAGAVVELLEQGPAPDVIVHATSSAGTQAGLVAGCSLLGIRTTVLGVSADDPAGVVTLKVRDLVERVGERLGVDWTTVTQGCPIEVDDSFVGEGYGIPTTASRAALSLVAHTEALFLDPTYTAKAMAGLIARVRDGRLGPDATVLFWHTGGQPALFA